MCDIDKATLPVTAVPKGCTPVAAANFKYKFRKELGDLSKLKGKQKKVFCERNVNDAAARDWAKCKPLASANMQNQEEALTAAKEALDVAQKTYKEAQAARTAAEKNLLPANNKRIRACENFRDIPNSQAERKKEASDECDATTAAYEAVNKAIQQTKQAVSEADRVVTEAKKKVTELTPQLTVEEQMIARRLQLHPDGDDEDGNGDGDGDGDESSSSSDWNNGEDGGGANDDDEGDADDVFEPALQRVMISMLLKNRRLSATECVRRICAGDFSDCQLPCLAEQRLLRGFVGYPYYRDVVHRAVHRLYPLLQLRYR